MLIMLLTAVDFGLLFSFAITWIVELIEEAVGLYRLIRDGRNRRIESIGECMARSK